MTPEQLLAQYQAQYQSQLEQTMHQYQTFIVAYGVISLASFALFCWVIYMFYCRLSDIGEELRKFRIAYEMTQDRRDKVESTRNYVSGSGANPFQAGGSEDRYKPKG